MINQDKGPQALLPEADAHAQAALLLVESLLHGLTAGSVLSVGEAVDVVEDALEAQTAIADETPSPSARAATELLARVMATLKTT